MFNIIIDIFILIYIFDFCVFILYVTSLVKSLISL